MNTDPIADLLTRLRNAALARHETTELPASKMKKEVLRVLKEHQLIEDFSEKAGEGPQKVLTVQLIPRKQLSLRRVSKPGQRIYKKANEIFPVMRGYGISIVSTSQGIMTGDEARKKGVGGEILCEAA